MVSPMCNFFLQMLATTMHAIWPFEMQEQKNAVLSCQHELKDTSKRHEMVEWLAIIYIIFDITQKTATITLVEISKMTSEEVQ